MPRTEFARGQGSSGRIPTVFLVLMAVATACSGNAPRRNLDASHRSSATPYRDPRARLVALGDEWTRAFATITYRTVAPVPGQAATAHLCLRQMFNGEADRSTVLRMCSRQGRLRLSWYPPERWRMDVTSPVEGFRLVSTPDGALLCETGADPEPPCRTIPSRRVLTASPFGFLLLSPGEILDEIGAPRGAVEASPATDVIGEQVECFHASGPRGHVEWCYSRDGLLLSFLRGSATEGWTSIDATSVSRPGAD